MHLSKVHNDNFSDIADLFLENQDIAGDMEQDLIHVLHFDAEHLLVTLWDAYIHDSFV